MKIIESYKESFKLVFNFAKSEVFRAQAAVLTLAVLFLAAFIVPLFLTNSGFVWLGMVLCCHVIFLPIYVKCWRIADNL